MFTVAPLCRLIVSKRVHKLPQQKILAYLALNYIHTSQLKCVDRTYEFPCQDEVDDLKKRYLKPEQLVKDLLLPISEPGRICDPKVERDSKLNGRYWKVRLHVYWPHVMTFTGSNQCAVQAEENAYLMACQLFKDAGLIYKKNNVMYAMTQAHVLGMLENMYNLMHISTKTKACPRKSFHLKSSCDIFEGKIKWKSKLTVPSLEQFTVTSVSNKLQTSNYVACLMACMKLKMLKLLDKQNNLAEERILTKFDKPHTPYFTVEEFDPHFQIYVDASGIGFGAYLLTKWDDKLRWISEPWNVHFQGETDSTELVQNHFDSCFFESYALVAACYTWKHKFRGKRVLCWSDNTHAVKLVNNMENVSTYRDSRFGNLGDILLRMCRSHGIEVRALHVNRVNNVPADLLSRVEVERFKQIFPKAEMKSKKVKKLLFRNPLVPKDFDPRNTGLK